MKISAPSLKLEMALREVVVRDGKPVIICRVGVYDATTELSREDLRTVLGYVLRPSILIAFARLLFSKAQPARNG